MKSIFLVFNLIPYYCHASSISSKDDILGLKGIAPDPFVAASPLIVAAVCSDGIAMVACHTASTEEQLLRPKERQQEQEETDKEGTFAKFWNDLPANHGGPFRIHKIDRSGTYLMAAGWRADCDMLLEKIRSIALQEVAVFGAPQWGLPYGRLLAQDASLWMAQVAVSEQVSDRVWIVINGS